MAMEKVEYIKFIGLEMELKTYYKLQVGCATNSWTAIGRWLLKAEEGN